MTNREAYEQEAGMGLDDLFFIYNDIDPDAEYKEYIDNENCKSE